MPEATDHRSLPPLTGDDTDIDDEAEDGAVVVVETAEELAQLDES